MKNKLIALGQQYDRFTAYIIKVAGQLLRSKYGLWVLGFISFIDAAMAFPGPVDPFIAAYTIANRTKVWVGYLLATVTSVLGGILLYGIATFFTVQLLAFLSPESQAAFTETAQYFDQGTFWITFLGAFTPIPYGLIVIAAAVLKGDIWLFILGSLLGRGLRYGIVAYIAYHFGTKALMLAQKHIKKLTVFVLIAGALYGLYLLIV